MIRRIPLAFALAILMAPPLGAQLGTTTAGEGFRIQIRLVGSAWEKELATGWNSLKAGAAGSGKAIDGLAIRNMLIPVRLQVATKNVWLPWAEGGAKTGAEGSPITSLKLTCEKRSVRYRGTFVGAGAREWVRDGEALEAGGAALESLEVELADAAPKGAASFEYRVSFAGSGFTPWMKEGQVAEGTGEKPFATALQMRGAPDLRYEVSFQQGGGQPTALEGEVAGDQKGKRAIESLRIFSAIPIRYRVKIEKTGWGPWVDAGVTAGTGGRAYRIEAIAIELKH